MMIYWYDAGFGVFLVHPPMASVLLSASVERFSVSRMRDFIFTSFSYVALTWNITSIQWSTLSCLNLDKGAINRLPPQILLILVYLVLLEDTARYARLLLSPAEGFSLQPRLFLPFGQKKMLLCCFGPFLAIFGVQ